jgi:hypothetical protein
MEDDKKHYQFVNSQTGYVIAYFTIPVNTHPDTVNQMLEDRKKELAIEHAVFVDTIYWKVEKPK